MQRGALQADKDLELLNNPQRLLAEGMTIYEKKNKDKGRMIFSLSELPVGVLYVTDRNNTILRKNDTKLFYNDKTELFSKSNNESNIAAAAAKKVETLPTFSPPPQAQAKYPPLVTNEKSNGKKKGKDKQKAPEEPPRVAGVQAEDSEEVKQNITQAESTARESKQAMQRILKRAEETREVAAGTLTKLEEQGEQLERVQGRLDSMQYKFDQADRDLKVINSVWSQLGESVLPHSQKTYDTNAKFSKEEEEMRKKQAKVNEKREKKEAKQQKKKEKEMEKRGLGAGNSHLPPELGVLSKEAQSDVVESDQMLDVLGSTVQDLRSMALQMGDELNVHNARLEVLKESSEKTEARLKQTNAKVKKQM